MQPIIFLPVGNVVNVGAYCQPALIYFDYQPWTRVNAVQRVHSVREMDHCSHFPETMRNELVSRWCVSCKMLKNFMLTVIYT